MWSGLVPHHLAPSDARCCAAVPALRWARLCAVSQHFSPREQTVSALTVGARLEWWHRWENHRKWEGKSDGGYFMLFCNASLDEMPHHRSGYYTWKWGLSYLQVCAIFGETLGYICLLFWSCLLPYTVKMVKKCGTVPLFIIRNLFVPCQLIFLGLTVNTAQSKQTKWCEARVWVFVLFCFLILVTNCPENRLSLLEIIIEQPKYQFFFPILSQRFF